VADGMMRLRYGRGRGHVAAMAFTYAVTAYALFALFSNARPWTVLLWLAGAIVAHDFVFLALYTLAYRLAARVAGARAADAGRRRLALWHAAAPAMLSLLLALMSLPLVLRLSEANYRPTTGMTQEAFLWRWLAITGALFALSGAVFAIRARRQTSPSRRGPRAADAPPARG